MQNIIAVTCKLDLWRIQKDQKQNKTDEVIILKIIKTILEEFYVIIK